MTRELLLLAATCVALAAHAETPSFPDAAASDPVALEWMEGSPPPADKVIRYADLSMYRFPQIRWSFANFRQLAPSRNIWRGAGRPAELPRALRGDIDGVTFQPSGGVGTMTWQESLAANYTDAILVLHKGSIVYERYFGVMTPHSGAKNCSQQFRCSMDLRVMPASGHRPIIGEVTAVGADSVTVRDQDS